MEIREGTIALLTLATIFMGLQIWWIGTTIVNGRSHKKNLADRHTTNIMQKDQLEIQKMNLEQLLKKH